MSIKLLEALEEAKQDYIDRDVNENGMDERDAMNIGFFMQHCINLLRDIYFRQMGIVEGVKSLIIEQDNLIKRVKKLEQAKTFFPMAEGKHQALLNNCVDNDEAILRKREIKE